MPNLRHAAVALCTLLSFALLPLANNAAQPNFSAVPNSISATVQPATISDINGDGWWEALRSLHTGTGTLNSLHFREMHLGTLLRTASAAGLPLNDARMADCTGGGCADLVTRDYASTANADLQARLFITDGLGHSRSRNHRPYRLAVQKARTDPPTSSNIADGP